jgi:hypothetical protein
MSGIALGYLGVQQIFQWALAISLASAQPIVSRQILNRRLVSQQSLV